MRFIVDVEGSIIKSCHRSFEIYAESEEDAKLKAIEKFEDVQSKVGNLLDCKIVSSTQVGTRKTRSPKPPKSKK